MRILIITSLLFSGWATATTIRCGHLFDAASGQMLTQQLITVDGERIVSVAADNGQAVDLDYAGGYCLPGLLDMHTHITHQNSATRYLEKFQDNEADVAINGVMYARITLEAGFTTIRDVGDTFNASVALRNAINQGKVPGPRIYTSAKSLATTGGGSAL